MFFLNKDDERNSKHLYEQIPKLFVTLRIIYLTLASCSLTNFSSASSRLAFSSAA